MSIISILANTPPSKADIAMGDKLAKLKRPSAIIDNQNKPTKADKYPSPNNSPRPPISVKLSPKNDSRPEMKEHRYIILHTTEAPDTTGATNRMQSQGLCHFLVRKDGTICQFISTLKQARHSGLSSYEGAPHPDTRAEVKPSLDAYGIGIEVAGSHSTPLTKAQIKSLRLLLGFLQSKYKIVDSNVITHSMCALSQNKWHPLPSRGRKECGAQFMDPKVRGQLGLTARNGFDLEVANGWTGIANSTLYAKLFPQDKLGLEVGKLVDSKQGYIVLPPGKGPYAIAGASWDSRETKYIFPDGKEYNGDQIRKYKIGVPAYTKIKPDQRDKVKGRG